MSFYTDYYKNTAKNLGIIRLFRARSQGSAHRAFRGNPARLAIYRCHSRTERRRQGRQKNGENPPQRLRLHAQRVFPAWYANISGAPPSLLEPSGKISNKASPMPTIYFSALSVVSIVFGAMSFVFIVFTDLSVVPIVFKFYELIFVQK